MEKAPGTQLFRVWDQMNDLNRLSLVENLTKLESQLASIQFPAFGGLYLRQSIDDESKYQLLDATIDPSSSYCIGPSCDQSWLLDPRLKTSGCELDVGPCKLSSLNLFLHRGLLMHDLTLGFSLCEFGVALARREAARALLEKPSDSVPVYGGTTDEKLSLLESTIKLMGALQSHPELTRHAIPALWHTDLHMGNIFVSDNDPSQILSVIDWQSITVSPMFLQVRWPEFLKRPKNYTVGLVKPKLPDNFDDLDTEDKELAMYEWKQRTRAKAYEVSNFLNNRESHRALNVPRLFRELFLRTAQIWEEGVVPLRACFIEIFSNWQGLGMPGDCPFAFTDNEINQHEQQFEQYQEWQEVHEFAREYLDTDADGWIPPESNVNEKRERNEALLELTLQRMAGLRRAEDVRKMWPFLEGL